MVIYHDKNTNLVINQSYIYVAVKDDAENIWIDWKYKYPLNFSKYQIKETDMRQKTATFTSTDYLDLTTGQYCVLITSPYHEDFAGIILSVELDEKTGLYNYQCQDWSRNYQTKLPKLLKSSGASLYRVLQRIITRFSVRTDVPASKSGANKYKNTLSGLRPYHYYDNKKWSEGTGNPFSSTSKMIFDSLTYMDIIRNIVFSNMDCGDVYFSNKGIMQIERYNRTEWLKSGLYLAPTDFVSEKFKFDTTNIITEVTVDAENKLSGGRTYTSEDLIKLNLSAFFGEIGTGISNPNQSSTQNTSKTNTASSTTNSTQKEGDGITVFMNSDNIVSKSVDKQRMRDLAGYLQKRGYKTEIGGVDPSTHYDDIGKVKQNGIYLTIYGGACAGTLKEQIESSHFHSVLKKRNAKMVIGFFPPAYKYLKGLKWLPRAHDDNFSPSGFSGISNPEQKILDAGIGLCYGKDAKEMASSFPGFKKGVQLPNAKNKTTSTVQSTPKNTIDVNSALYIENEKREAKKKIQESVRDLLTLNMTLPLGNKALKYVHTNQFLFTELPKTFKLKYLGVIGEALNSSYSRFSGYDLDRWYIEEITINNDSSKFTMDLKLNPFATTLSKYRDANRKALKNYTDAVKEKNNKTTTSTGTSNILNKVNNGENTTLKGGEGSTIDNLVKKIVGKETDGLKKCKLIHGWLQSNVRYAYYECTRYSSPESCLNHKGGLNCADTSRLTRAMMSSAGLNAYVVHRTYNGGHFWTVIEINGKKYASDQTGSGSEFNTVWKRSGRTGNGGYADYSHKDGKNPCC